MQVRTARHKLKPSTATYTSLRGVRWHLMHLRNACLQELRDSYVAARRVAARHGRDKPIAADWILVRQEEIVEFLSWQVRQESDLRRRHAQLETRRIAKLHLRIAAGDPKVDPTDLNPAPWRSRTAESFGRPISKADHYRRLALIRQNDPEGIGRIPVAVLRDQVDIVHKAMDAFFERVKAGKTPGFPRFKSYDRIRSLGSPIGGGISLEGDLLKAPMLWHGAIRMRMHRDLPGVGKTVRLTYDGRFWWASIVCECGDAATTHARPGTVRGIDAGVRRLLTFDDGSFVDNPKFLKEDAPETRRLARALARCKRASHGRNKAKRTLARAKNATANRRRTHHHKVSKDVVAAAETNVVEALKLKNMMRSAAGTVAVPGVNVAQKRGLNRGMNDAAISILYGMIRYKAASAGGRVIAVVPMNSSNDCSLCGEREPGARRGSRYVCSCGADLDADHNGARIVLQRGLLAA